MEPTLDEPATRLAGAIAADRHGVDPLVQHLHGVGVEGAQQPFLRPGQAVARASRSSHAAGDLAQRRRRGNPLLVQPVRGISQQRYVTS